MKSLIERLAYRSKKAEHGQVIIDEDDLDRAIAAIQALTMYHDSYSDRRFAPEGSWEAAEAGGRLDAAYDRACALAKALPPMGTESGGRS